MSIAQQLIERSGGDKDELDFWCDEHFESIEERGDSTIYTFKDGSRIRLWFEGFEKLND